MEGNGRDWEGMRYGFGVGEDTCHTQPSTGGMGCKEGNGWMERGVGGKWEMEGGRDGRREEAGREGGGVENGRLIRRRLGGRQEKFMYFEG